MAAGRYNRAMFALFFTVFATRGDYDSGYFLARLRAPTYCTTQTISKPTFVGPVEDGGDAGAERYSYDWVRGWRDGQRSSNRPE